MELNEYGMRVWKHKTNKRLFLQQSYRWKDSLTLLDETEDRQIIDRFVASTFDFSVWEPMTQQEYDSVKSKYREVWGSPAPEKNEVLPTWDDVRRAIELARLQYDYEGCAVPLLTPEEIVDKIRLMKQTTK